MTILEREVDRIAAEIRKRESREPEVNHYFIDGPGSCHVCGADCSGHTCPSCGLDYFAEEKADLERKFGC